MKIIVFFSFLSFTLISCSKQTRYSDLVEESSYVERTQEERSKISSEETTCSPAAKVESEIQVGKVCTYRDKYSIVRSPIKKQKLVRYGHTISSANRDVAWFDVALGIVAEALIFQTGAYDEDPKLALLPLLMTPFAGFHAYYYHREVTADPRINYYDDLKYNKKWAPYNKPQTEFQDGSSPKTIVYTDDTHESFREEMVVESQGEAEHSSDYYERQEFTLRSDFPAMVYVAGAPLANSVGRNRWTSSDISWDKISVHQALKSGGTMELPVRISVENQDIYSGTWSVQAPAQQFDVWLEQNYDDMRKSNPLKMKRCDRQSNGQSRGVLECFYAQ